MYSEILAILLYLNEIEISSLYLQKINQMSLGMFENALNQKANTTSKNQLFLKNNFAFILTEDSFTLVVLKMHFVFFSSKKP